MARAKHPSILHRMLSNSIDGIISQQSLMQQTTQCNFSLMALKLGIEILEERNFCIKVAYPSESGGHMRKNDRRYPLLSDKLMRCVSGTSHAPEAEISTDMNKQLNGDEPGLVGYWKFDEETEGKIADTSPKQKRWQTHRKCQT